MTFFKYVKIFLELFRCSLHIIIYLLHSKKEVIKCDNKRWLTILNRKEKGVLGLLYLLSFFPEYRNLFYKRVGRWGIFLNIICPKLSTLYIATDDIGPGFYIQHGFATIIAAKSIGKNCWVNQQVTIGYGSSSGQPTIMDNVHVTSGAKIFNKITVGSNVKIGANAVVNKNVPADCTVIGVPAYIVRLNGIKTNLKL